MKKGCVAHADNGEGADNSSNTQSEVKHVNTLKGNFSFGMSGALTQALPSQNNLRITPLPTPPAESAASSDLMPPFTYTTHLEGRFPKQKT